MATQATDGAMPLNLAPLAAADLPPASLSSIQKNSALAIVNIFETGSVLGDYSQITLLAHDSGHLTFGRSQTTLGSGNLAVLVDRYCATQGATMAQRLTPYQQRLRDRDVTLDENQLLQNILRASADDHLMREAQDTFFDTVYWQPAAKRAAVNGIRTPLGVAVVYDSTVHGSWDAISQTTNAKYGALQDIGEQKWIAAYVATRLNWMVNNANPAIQATRYRMDTFQSLIAQQRWGLELPLVVRGQEISLATLAATPGNCYAGPALASRPLTVASPLNRGADVRLLQLALSEKGSAVVADGIFGSGTSQTVRDYQSRNGFPATGIADINLIIHMCG